MGGPTCRWGASNGTIISDPYIGHTDAVTIVRIFPDGKSYLWISLSACGHTSRVQEAEVSPDGRRVISTSIGSTLNPQ